jgi:hypothetical protein
VTELQQAADASSPDKQELISALSDQLQTMGKMEAQLRKFEAEMEHTTTMLSTCRTPRPLLSHRLRRRRRKLLHTNWERNDGTQGSQTCRIHQ